MNDKTARKQRNHKNLKNMVIYARRYFPWAVFAAAASVLCSYLEVDLQPERGDPV